MNAAVQKSQSPSWRGDLDSLAFKPTGHAAECVVHRRAFRVLLGIEPDPEDCRRYFEDHRAVFENAAAAKISAKSIPPSARFHLTSRDIRRASP
jgi:Protein of unknown function (DUF1488)